MRKRTLPWMNALNAGVADEDDGRSISGENNNQNSCHRCNDLVGVLVALDICTARPRVDEQPGISECLDGVAQEAPAEAAGAQTKTPITHRALMPVAGLWRRIHEARAIRDAERANQERCRKRKGRPAQPQREPPSSAALVARACRPVHCLIASDRVPNRSVSSLWQAHSANMLKQAKPLLKRRLVDIGRRICPNRCCRYPE